MTVTGELLWSATPDSGMGGVLEVRRASGDRLAVVFRSSGRQTMTLTRAQARSLALVLLTATDGGGPPPGGSG